MEATTAPELGDPSLDDLSATDLVGAAPDRAAAARRVEAFCVAELGAALGVTTDAVKKLIGHATEMAHRLPRVWKRVQSGEVPVWRARLVAEETIHSDPALTPEAMAWIDAQAITLYGLATSDPEDEEHDSRFVRIDAPIGPFAGTMHIEAEVSNADGHDLAQALSAGAAAIKAGGKSAPGSTPPTPRSNPAGHRPQRTDHREQVRTHRPAATPRGSEGPDLCLPVVHATGTVLRPRPRRTLRPRRCG